MGHQHGGDDVTDVKTNDDDDDDHYDLFDDDNI
jgi:hypothetical protein